VACWAEVMVSNCRRRRIPDLARKCWGTRPSPKRYNYTIYQDSSFVRAVIYESAASCPFRSGRGLWNPSFARIEKCPVSISSSMVDSTVGLDGETTTQQRSILEIIGNSVDQFARKGGYFRLYRVLPALILLAFALAECPSVSHFLNFLLTFYSCFGTASLDRRSCR
jgi:hypothetical protein